MSKLNIVLYEPEIPQNTGNIARLCACTGASLYLVGKLGFSLSSKYTKRAGLDYWDSVDLHKIDTMDELLEANKDANFYYLTTKTKRLYTDIDFQEISGSNLLIKLKKIIDKDEINNPENVLPRPALTHKYQWKQNTLF